MESGLKKGPKKIEISSSSLVALKAELLNKQSQIQKVKQDGFQTIRNRSTKKTAVVKQNSGVEARAKRDEEQKDEDQPTLDKSRVILEEKAKLYERLSRDKALLDEETISEDQSFFLVDFQQKVVQHTITERQTQKVKSSNVQEETSSSDEAGEKEYTAANPDEEWVDYVDSFGRTRRCLKKDLAVFQQRDAELNKQPVASPTSTSYGNFVPSSEQNSGEDPQNISGLDEEARKRQRQLWEEEEEKNRQKNKVHYQDILYQEARQHGVGFYSFSKDEEERAKQMEELERIRKQTEMARAQTAQTSLDKQSALEARLKKVRDRKRQKLGLPPLSKKQEEPKRLPTLPAEPEAPPVVDSAKETEDKMRKLAAGGLPQSAKIRPWDFGKEGVPVPKKPVMSQHSWVERKREERKQEFAPPSAFTENDTSRPRKFAKHQESATKTNPIMSEESIIAGLAFIRKMQFPCPGTQPSSSNKREEDIDEENDDNLMPPGETDDPQLSAPSSRWRSVPSRGAEIAPPASMDYYSNSSSATARRSMPSERTNVAESFSAGISERRNVAGDNLSTEKEARRPKWDFSA
ncbi:LOW QUALITY PROTEIN: coiled-coil domain-containing protein 174-like [Daphnia carinata]|uniref:LOW QUALITY PROTEIN: coiled-coil domain-containing protein 174-like n=1 Tax=Daphnia carinata TaxID=120202 RepID=UPI00286944B2|nr:LOW QUALITY PROTEIN: coiled-coil domain-containing protein 174-like [Daphnia carinata]